MIIAKKHWVAAGIAVIITIVAVVAWRWYEQNRVPAFPINTGDTVASWTFKGPYTGNETLTAQANVDITHLRSLIGKGQYDDYDLYVGIGNDDNLLGDGAGAYANYDRAAKIHPMKGLVYTNLGHLFDELGAYHTAADAYAKAVAVEPVQLIYHIMRLSFLTMRLPSDNALILTALTDASNQFGDNAQILATEAQWLESQKRYVDALSAWERAKLLSPGQDTTAIDAAIARLKAKQ